MFPIGAITVVVSLREPEMCLTCDAYKLTQHHKLMEFVERDKTLTLITVICGQDEDTNEIYTRFEPEMSITRGLFPQFEPIHPDMSTTFCKWWPGFFMFRTTDFLNHHATLKRGNVYCGAIVPNSNTIDPETPTGYTIVEDPTQIYCAAAEYIIEWINRSLHNDTLFSSLVITAPNYIPPRTAKYKVVAKKH